MPTESLRRRLLKENVVLLVVAMLVVMPLLGPFTEGASGRALRNGLFELLGVLLLMVLLARVEARGGLRGLLYLARTGVNTPLALFLLWAGVRAVWVPDRAFAVGELLRLGTGALVCFAIVLHVEARAQLCLLLDCLLGMVLLVMGYAILFQGSEAANGMFSVFPSRHHLSAILVVLLPLLASLAVGERERRRRMVAITAAILGGVGLLLCLERSAWIAAAAGCCVWFFLILRMASSARSWRPALAVAGCGLLIGVLFLAVSGVQSIVVDRAQEIAAATRGGDPSFAWRIQKWRATAAMVAARPVWGWGPGQYVLREYAYTDLGLPPEIIRTFGAGFEDMAYNEYLQTAAELGLVGLALYLLLLASFFSKAARALHRLPVGLRRTTLLGCMAGVTAQMVDAMANGSWRYAECSIFFWFILGVGMAVVRMGCQTPPPPASPGARLRAAEVQSEDGPAADFVWETRRARIFPASRGAAGTRREVMSEAQGRRLRSRVPGGASWLRKEQR